VKQEHHSVCIGLCVLFVVALGSFAPLQSSAAVQTEQEYIWEVRNGSNVVFLLGSIHLLRPQDYPLPKVFYQAFQQADRIFFEVDPKEFEDPATSDYIIQKALYPFFDNLGNHLPQDTYAALSNYTFNNRLSNLDSFKPWYVNMALGNFELGKSGYTNILAVDQHFYDRSLQERKTVKGLETTQFQIDLFASLAESNQVATLTAFLQNPEQVRTDTSALVEAWKSGNAEAVRLYEEQQRALDPESYNRVLVERNELWLPQIITMLQETNVTLVVVGASHFIGEKGLVNLLRMRGYEVEQLPKLPVSQPQVISLQKNGSSLTFTWKIKPGRSYLMQTAGKNWTWIPSSPLSSLFATNEFYIWEAPISADLSCEFFRMKTMP